MPPVVLANPILNSPFAEPARHYRFSDERITDEICEGRRASGYFLPIASPRKKGGQLKFDTGRIAIKVINHYGDEVLKVFKV